MSTPSPPAAASPATGSDAAAGTERPLPGPAVLPAFAGTPGGVSYLYMMAAFLIVMGGLRIAQEILQPFLLAAFVAVVSVPVYAWLVQKKVASWLALLIVICGLLGLMLIMFWILMTSLADFTARQDHYAEQLRLRTLPLRQAIEKLIPETPAAPAAEPDSLSSPTTNESAAKEVAANETAVPETAANQAAALESAEETPDSADGIAAAPAPAGAAAASQPRAVATDVAATSLEAVDGQPASEAVEMEALGEAGDPDELSEEADSLRDQLTAAPWLPARPPLEAPRSRRSWKQLIMSQFDPSKMVSLAATLALSVSQIVSNTVLILLTVVFILLEASTFPAKLRLAFGPNQETLQRYQLVVESVRSYLVIKTAMSAMTGVLVALWLWLFGVPFAGLWGTLAFLLNYIPNIGSIIAAIPALVVAWLDLGWLPCVACGVGFFVVNMGIGNILEPRLMGRGMGLSALVVFCSMVFWGWVLGPVGMLLSVPLTMGVRVALEVFDDTRWLGVLMGNAE